MAVSLSLVFALLPVTGWPPGGTPAAGTAYAATTYTDTGLPTRSGAEIAAKWKAWMKPDSDYNKPYVKVPSTVSPYSAGSLRADYIQEGVDAVNFYRFISGLPADITATAELNSAAQYGSVLLAAEGKFSHTPPQPANMAKNFFDLGYAATSSSNIYGSLNNDEHVVFASVEAYMDDSDASNVSRVGHRRWILFPDLLYTGFGQATAKDKWEYSAMKVFDDKTNINRPQPVSFDYLPYPAAGEFPIEVFNANAPWSVSLNVREYGNTQDRSKVTVAMKRLRDGKTWTMSTGDNNKGEQGEYFTVDNQTYGSGMAIIFRPGNVGSYKAGDRFEVTISGIVRKDGMAATITYAVDFISAENYVPPAGNSGTGSGTGAGSGQQPAGSFSDTDKSWARETIEWAVAAGIVNGYPDGTFRPTATITEAEFLKMFTEMLDYDVSEFPVPGGNWSAPYYALAEFYGFALGGLDQITWRTSAITRLAVAELIASGEGLDLTGDDAIQYVLDSNYAKGKIPGDTSVASYAGADSLTRAEAVQFIRNLVDAGY